MRTDRLVILVRAASVTVPRADVWPNGLGFDAGRWSFAPIGADRADAPAVWYARCGPVGQCYGAYGESPELARTAARTMRRENLARYARTRPYVGIDRRDDKHRTVFRAASTPGAYQYGRHYSAIVGPFRTTRAARLCAAVPDSGQSVADYERAARRAER